mmetsp:Transcript_106157/g.297175  ORF Transcript_106157/g.297175 Transcript_106157/m.297175 type:complete len:260 (+) Transcript_106157:341-1120(+)
MAFISTRSARVPSAANSSAAASRRAATSTSSGSARRSSEAKRNAPLCPETAANTTSRSSRSSGAAKARAAPCCCTAARTMARLARSGGAACCRAAPAQETAARTTSASPRSSSLATLREYPWRFTAAIMTWRLPRISCGALRSTSCGNCDVVTRSSHKASSGLRRIKLSQRAPALSSAVRRSSWSAGSLTPAMRRCSLTGLPESFSTSALTSDTVLNLSPISTSQEPPARLNTFTRDIGARCAWEQRGRTLRMGGTSCA